MCSTHDAERHEELAKLLLTENELDKAREHYLEAASIYTLHNEMDKANICYKRSREAINQEFNKELTRQELAKFTLEELDSIRKGSDKDSIKALAELGKKLEDSDPQKAATHYLRAAELMLHESEHHPEKEDEFIEVANKMYLKAKQLKKQEPKKAELIRIVDNKLTFADIGGLEELKEEIRFKIIEPFKNPEVFKFYNKKIGGGILMYGPPGCGKSLIAKATANEADAAFMHVKCSDLKSKFVGETEQNIAELFKKAREQPTIIFFDEFEALGADRTESLSYEKSAVAQLLTEIDGFDSDNQKILLLAATNEPWSIDPALRREGRFGNTIFIPLPDKQSREDIFRIHMQGRPVKDLDYKRLAEKTEGFSGADIKAVCEAATDIPLKESFTTRKKRHIEMKDMLVGIKKSQSVMKQWFQKARQQIKNKKLQESFKELATT
ncbi:AAA family ATPase [Candidatus Woesearchaeota archaeon]|nr:AAA family ATPase [Candidatus Woesearchaeota archaeon]